MKKIIILTFLLSIIFTQNIYSGLFSKSKLQPGDMWRKGYKAQTYIITNTDFEVANFLITDFQKDIPKVNIISLNDVEANLQNLEKSNVIFLIDKSLTPNLIKNYQYQFNYAFKISFPIKFNEGVISIGKHYKNKNLRYVFVAAPNKEWLLRMIAKIKSFEKNEPIDPIIQEIKLVDIFTNADKSITDKYYSNFADLFIESFNIYSNQDLSNYDISNEKNKEIAIFIDRSKKYSIPQFLKQYLPQDDVINNLKRNEVLIYKKDRGISPPVVFISAPNNSVLKYQIEEYNSSDKFPEQQKILTLRDVLIISNASESIVDDLLGEDYEELYKFTSTSSGDLSNLKFEQNEIITLIDRSNLPDLTNEIKNFIPQNAKKLVFKKWQAIAIKEESNNLKKIFISAPSRPTLTEMIKTYKNISSIPTEVRIFDFPYSIVVSQTRPEKIPYLNPTNYKGFYDYFSLDNYQYNQEFEKGDEIFLFSRNIPIPMGVAKVLPDNILKTELNKNEALIFALQKENSNKKKYFIIAPTLDKLYYLLKEYSSLNKISSEPTIISFADWRPVKKILLLRKNYFDSSIGQKTMNSLINKLKILLSGEGFQVFLPIANLDINVIENLFFSGTSPTPDELQNLGLINYSAVSFVELTDVSGQKEYYLGKPIRYPPPMDKFSLKPPDQPGKPNPNQRRLFSGHEYNVVDGSRENDPKYQKDLQEWENKLMPKYREKYANWEQKKYEYENQRNNLQVTWEWDVLEKEWINCKANINIYDLKSGKKLSSYTGDGNYEIKGTRANTIKRNVRGDDATPDEPYVPDPKETVQLKIIDTAIEKALSRFLNNLITKDSISPSEEITNDWPPTLSRQKISAEEKEKPMSTQEQKPAQEQNTIKKQDDNQSKKSTGKKKINIKQRKE